MACQKGYLSVYHYREEFTSDKTAVRRNTPGIKRRGWWGEAGRASYLTPSGEYCRFQGPVQLPGERHYKAQTSRAFSHLLPTLGAVFALEASWKATLKPVNNVGT